MEFTKVAVTELKEYENNPRRGNVDALAESLEANGQYKPIVVQRSTNQVLAGNHLLKAAKSLDWETIDVVYVDVDDAQAKKIVLADNRLADLGTYDEQALIDLLQEVSFEGTGYEPEDLTDLLALVEEQITPEYKIVHEDTHQENVQNRQNLASRAEHYAERTIRLLMCEYPNDQYIWAIERLTEVREKLSLDSNAEAIIAVLEHYTGEKAPNA